MAHKYRTRAPELNCAIVAMTCEKPEASDRPISHWSQREIADEAVRRGLVSSISQRSVGRFLKKRPTSTTSFPVLADPEARSRLRFQVRRYLRGLQGCVRSRLRTIASSASTRRTGIQARERMAPDLPLVPGKIERHEFEYRRHGTQALIAALDVTTGEVEGVIGNTRCHRTRVYLLLDIGEDDRPMINTRDRLMRCLRAAQLDAVDPVTTRTRSHAFEEATAEPAKSAFVSRITDPAAREAYISVAQAGSARRMKFLMGRIPAPALRPTLHAVSPAVTAMPPEPSRGTPCR
jgi:hypothetical protein